MAKYSSMLYRYMYTYTIIVNILLQKKDTNYFNLPYLYIEREAGVHLQVDSEEYCCRF